MRRGAGLLLLVLLLAETVVGSAEPLAVVRVPERAAVNGPDIVLGEIASIETADSDLGRRLQELSLGRAALPGQSRELNVATMRVRMRQQSLPEKHIVIEAPQPAVSVVTRSQVVTGQALVETAEAAVRRRGQGTHGPALGSSEVVFACAVPDDVIVSDGLVELQVSRLIGAAPGPIVVSVDVIVDNTVQRSVMIRCDARVALDVPVTTVALHRHAPLDEDSVTVERREFSSLPRGLLEPSAIFNESSGAGMRTTRPLSPGTVLTESMVEASPVVLRGRPVQIVAMLHHVQVSAPGVALEDGRVGDVIRVENSTSGQIIRARVIAADRVEAVVR